MPITVEQSRLGLRDTRALLRKSALVNALVGLALLTALSLTLSHRLGLSDWTLAKSGALYVAAVGWIYGHLMLHLPHARLFPANQVTLLRLALTALLGGWVGEPLDPGHWLPASVAGLILALDGLDGWLARRGGWASPFGARFDMETDALLMLVLAALIWSQDKAGAWILLTGLARYLFIGAARIRPWLGHPLPPSRRRQTVCVLLVLTLLLILTPPIQPTEGIALAAIALALVLYSFGVDIRWLWRNRASDEAARSGHHGPASRRPRQGRLRHISATAAGEPET